MTVGERIRKFRTKKGWTQKKLGEESNIAEPTIRRYELGKLNPKYETLEKIADALGIDVIFLKYDLSDIHTVDTLSPENQKEIAERTSAIFKNIAQKGLDNIEEHKKTLLLQAYDQLNRTGKTEAIKRVKEMAEVGKFIKPDDNDPDKK